jgi:hypothetical protein
MPKKLFLSSLFVGFLMFSSCSLNEDEVSSNDLNCISLSADYVKLWRASEESFSEFKDNIRDKKISFNGIIVENEFSPNYAKAKTLWIENDPQKREIVFTEFLLKNSNTCSWLYMPEKMIEYSSSKKWKNFRK